MEEETTDKILFESQINTLIPHGTLLQTLTVTQLMHKFTTFEVNHTFITIFIKAWMCPYPQPVETNRHYLGPEWLLGTSAGGGWLGTCPCGSSVSE
jgi:hypothetical protein